MNPRHTDQTSDEKLRTALKPLRGVKAPPDFASRVARACAADDARRRRRRLFLRASITGLAAVLVLAVWNPWHGPLGRRPSAPPRTVAVGTSYSPAEIASARRQLVWTLAVTDRILDRSSHRALADVLGRRIPGTISRSLTRALHRTAKGNS